MIFHDQKMKIHDLSAQHILPSKRYTTYECIPELVVTVPSARSTNVKKIQEAQLMLTTGSTRLAVSRGHQT